MNAKHHNTMKFAREEMKRYDMTISCVDAEYRVNFRRGSEETAYYTNDIQDAIATGKAMRNELNTIYRNMYALPMAEARD